MYGFAGRSFNFIGDPGKIYNIISTQNMQVCHLPMQAQTPVLRHRYLSSTGALKKVQMAPTSLV